MPKFYDMLGLEAGASKDDIKKAYKKKAMQCHPDKGGDPEEWLKDLRVRKYPKQAKGGQP